MFGIFNVQVLDITKITLIFFILIILAQYLWHA